MEHFYKLLFLPLEWKNQIHEDGAKRCAYKKRRCNDIAWALAMQKCGLSISLQQLKMKIIELKQTRVTPLWDGIPCNNQWYRFKHKHLEVNI